MLHLELLAAAKNAVILLFPIVDPNHLISPFFANRSGLGKQKFPKCILTQSLHIVYTFYQEGSKSFKLNIWNTIFLQALDGIFRKPNAFS